MREGWAQVSETVFNISYFFSNFFGDFRQVMLDVSKQDFGEFLREEFSAQLPRRQSGVNGVSGKIHLLPFDGIPHTHVVHNILL